MKTLAVLLLALVGAAAFAQDAYRWVGKDGKVHYSDAPPPPDAVKAEEKRLDGSVVGSEKYSYETRQAMANFPVTLYVSTTCGTPCDTARSYMKKRAIPFAEKTLATPADFEAMKKTTQSEVVPTLKVGSMVSKGFQETDWSGLIETAGYPPATVK